jgi:hypothetical protein
MATYTLTDETKNKLMNIPSDILPKDVLNQTKTFPIRSILEGIEKGLEPEDIGNMVYNELSKLQMDKFTDVGMRNTNDWAKFVQAKVQSELKTMISTDTQVEDNPDEDETV